MSEAHDVDEAAAAAAAGLADSIESDAKPEKPEVVTPEVVQVDTSHEDEDFEHEAKVMSLPVRVEPGAGGGRTIPGSSVALVPARNELAVLVDLSVTLAVASNTPKDLKNAPAAILAVLLTGRELDIPPMTALRNCHVIDGKVTLNPKIRAAMVHRQKLGRIWPHQGPREVVDSEGNKTWKLCECGSPQLDNDDESATWHGERADDVGRGIIYSSTFTRAQADNVKIRNDGSKLGGKDNWQNYPDRMLSWRSLGYLLDDAFPEVGTGLYSPDELGAVTDEQGEPIFDVASRDSLTEQAQKQRQSNAAAAKDEPTAPPDTVASFKARIEKIKLYKDAPTALMSLWNGRRPNGDQVEALPKVDELLYKHCKMASALIDMIEKRIAKGEFGEPQEPQQDPAPDDPPLDDGHAPDEGEHAPPAEGDPAADPDSGNETPPSDATESPQDPPVAPDEPSVPSDPAPEPGGTLSLDVDSLPADGTPAADLAWTEAAMQADPLWTRQLLDDVATEVQAIDVGDLTGVMKALDLSANGLSESTRRARIAARRARLRIQKAAGL